LSSLLIHVLGENRIADVTNFIYLPGDVRHERIAMPSNPCVGVPQYSTAVSDGVLASITIFVVCQLLAANRLYAAFGFFTVAAAAVFGVIRFSQACPSSRLVSLHRYLSWLAQAVGMSLVSASFIQNHSSFLTGFVVVVPIVIALLQGIISQTSWCSTAGEIVGSVAVVAVFVVGCVTANGFAILGTALTAFAGVVVKTEGQIGGVLRVDVFHYILAFANIVLMKGLAQYDLPAIYYRR